MSSPKIKSKKSFKVGTSSKSPTSAGGRPQQVLTSADQLHELDDSAENPLSSLSKASSPSQKKDRRGSSLKLKPQTSSTQKPEDFTGAAADLPKTDRIYKKYPELKQLLEYYNGELGRFQSAVSTLMSDKANTQELRTVQRLMREYYDDFKDTKDWREASNNEIQSMKIKMSQMGELEQKLFTADKKISNMETAIQHQQDNLNTSNTSNKKMVQILDEAIKDIQIKLQPIKGIQARIELLDLEKATKAELLDTKEWIGTQYLSLDRFQRFRLEFDALESEKKLNFQYTKDKIHELHQIIDNHRALQLKFEANVESFKKLCGKKEIENTSKFNAVNRDINTKKEEVRHILNSIDKIYDTFETRKVVKVLQDRLEGFANIEHVKQLKTIFLPKIEKFTVLIDEFQKDNQHVRECIITFDKTISTKASKSDMLELRHDMEETFVHKKHWSDVRDGYKKMHDDNEERRRKMENELIEFKLEEASSIQSTCQEMVSKKYSNYDRIQKEFGRFFNQKLLTSVLDSKADIENINELNNAKASKAEVGQQRLLIECLNERVKKLAQLSTQFAATMEMIESSVSDFSLESRRKFLRDVRKTQTQAKVINQWINEQDLEHTVVKANLENKIKQKQKINIPVKLQASDKSLNYTHSLSQQRNNSAEVDQKRFSPKNDFLLDSHTQSKIGGEKYGNDKASPLSIRLDDDNNQPDSCHSRSYSRGVLVSMQRNTEQSQLQRRTQKQTTLLLDSNQQSPNVHKNPSSSGKSGLMLRNSYKFSSTANPMIEGVSSGQNSDGGLDTTNQTKLAGRFKDPSATVSTQKFTPYGRGGKMKHKNMKILENQDGGKYNTLKLKDFSQQLKLKSSSNKREFQIRKSLKRAIASSSNTQWHKMMREKRIKGNNTVGPSTTTNAQADTEFNPITHPSPVNLNINQFGKHAGRTPPKRNPSPGASPSLKGAQAVSLSSDGEVPHVPEKNLKYFNSIFIFPQ